MKYTLFTALSLATGSLAHGFNRRGHGHAHPRHVANVVRDAAGAQPTPPPSTDPAASGLPPLASITANMPDPVTIPLFTTFAAGATPPIPGAPALPTGVATAIVAAAYPTADVIPPTDSPEVQGWLKVLANVKIPQIGLNTDLDCDPNSPAVAAAGPSGNCWWTCGGCLRDTDISVCPQKGTWGVSYDDGPSVHTPRILNYLNEKQVKATFFVIGGRAMEHPELLQAEYLLGHQISIHTWSHTALTNLTNEQIVAELGWTQKIIKDIIGVSPSTFRAPYGDLDDRVRAVAAAMGLTPIQWTGHDDDEFDTDDWKIPGGQATGPQSLAAFDRLLDLSNNISTGFIVLEHDLYAAEVAMSVGYFLPAAETHNPSFKLESVNQCLGIPLSNVYVETTTNTTTTTPPASSGSSSSIKPSGSSSASASVSKSGSSSGTSVSGQSSASTTAKPSSALGSVGITWGAMMGAVGLAAGLVASVMIV